MLIRCVIGNAVVREYDETMRHLVLFTSLLRAPCIITEMKHIGFPLQTYFQC